MSSNDRSIHVPVGGANLEGNLTVPDGAAGVVLFAHGSGSSRHSPRNRYVAEVLQQAGLATLLIDLLTQDEEQVNSRTGHLRFDIGLLASRLVSATDWLMQQPGMGRQREGAGVGYFGASTGGGAALVAAAERPEVVGAVVSRGGRPDLAGAAPAEVQAPTLLIVGGNDAPVIEMNREAMSVLRPPRLGSVNQLVIVPGATHLFEEPGALEEVARLARDWFLKHLGPLPGVTGCEP